MDRFILKVKYSPLEKRILDALPKDGSHISTLEIMGKVYDPGEEPRFARQSVLNAANSLIAKSDENGEPFEIFKTISNPVYFCVKNRD